MSGAKSEPKGFELMCRDGVGIDNRDAASQPHSHLFHLCSAPLDPTPELEVGHVAASPCLAERLGAIKKVGDIEVLDVVTGDDVNVNLLEEVAPLEEEVLRKRSEVRRENLG